MSDQLKPFCPVCHLQSVTLDQDAYGLFFANCLAPGLCVYRGASFPDASDAIDAHNANVDRLKLLFVEVWNLAIRHANNPERDPEADEYDQWLKNKGIE
jgi:hypothetical protein